MFPIALDCCRADVTPALQDFEHGLQHSFARVASDEAVVAIDIGPDSAHLQDWSFRKIVAHGEANRFLHTRLHAVSDEHDVKRLAMTGLVHILETARGLNPISGAFEPLEPQTQSGFGRHDQEQRSGECILSHCEDTSSRAKTTRYTLTGFPKLEQSHRISRLFSII